MSDPYNPLEAEKELTRHALELLSAYGFGAAIATKSDLICRDMDILKEIQKNAPVLCKLTITTTDDILAKKIEPQAPAPSLRLKALQELSEAGIPCCILLMPVLPWITDSEENLREIVKRAKETGVKYIYPALGLTLRDRQRAYYYEALDKAFPGLREKYIRKYGTRYRCTVPDAKRLWKSFANACDESGILYNMRDIIRNYQRGYWDGQLSLFC